MVIPFISGFFRVSSRDFHLAYRALVTTVGSWMAVEPNGTRLPSTLNPPRLGASLPSPRRGLPVGMLSLEGVYKYTTSLKDLKQPRSTLLRGTALHQVKRVNKPSDFSDEYVNKRVVVRMHDNSEIEGLLLEARRYWFKVKDSNAGVVYVNKGYVKIVEVFEEERK